MAKGKSVFIGVFGDADDPSPEYLVLLRTFIKKVFGEIAESHVGLSAMVMVSLAKPKVARIAIEEAQYRGWDTMAFATKSMKGRVNDPVFSSVRYIMFKANKEHDISTLMSGVFLSWYNSFKYLVRVGNDPNESKDVARALKLGGTRIDKDTHRKIGDILDLPTKLVD